MTWRFHFPLRNYDFNIIFAENNTTHNTYYHHLIKYAKQHPIIKIMNVHIDWFPEQINYYMNLTLNLIFKSVLEGHCLISSGNVFQWHTP